MKMLNGFLLTLICLASPMLEAATVSPCTEQLVLLDDQVKGVLDNIASLYVDFQSTDPTSGGGVKLLDLIRSKSAALEKIFPNRALLAAAKEYITAQIVKLEKEKASMEIKSVSEELSHREAEDKVLRPYEFFDSIHLKNKAGFSAVVTPDDIFIAQIDYSHILFKNLRDGQARQLEIPQERIMFWHRYSAASDEFFIGFNQRIFALKLRDIFSNTAAVVSLVPEQQILAVTSDLLEKINADIKKVRPGIEVVNPEFERVVVSNDGRFIVSMLADQNIKPPKGKYEYNVLIYDRFENKFKILDLPVEWFFQNFTLSENSKLITIKHDKDGIIYNLDTGDYVRTVKYTRAFQLSNDGRWDVGLDDENRIVMVDGLGKLPNKYFKGSLVDTDAFNKTVPKFTFSSDGSKLKATYTKGQVWIWDIQTTELLSSFFLPVKRDQGVVMDFSDNFLGVVETHPQEKDSDNFTLWKRRP